MALFDGLDLTNTLTKEQAEGILAQKGVTDADVEATILEMRKALAHEAALKAGVGTVLEVGAALLKIGLKVVAA